MKDRGAAAVEYGLLVAAIAALIVGIAFGLGTLVGNTFSGACASLKNRPTAVGPQNSCAPPGVKQSHNR